MKDKKNSFSGNSTKEKKLKEIQILEQNIQSLLFQKQAFQMELSETKTAKKEIENSNDIFKIIGHLMIKSDKEKIKKELSNKEKLLELRLKSIERQEKLFLERIEMLKNEVF